MFVPYYFAKRLKDFGGSSFNQEFTSSPCISQTPLLGPFNSFGDFSSQLMFDFLKTASAQKLPITTFYFALFTL